MNPSILAGIWIGLWVGTTAAHEVWKRTVVYPERPHWLSFAGALWEVAGFALALVVIFG